MTVENISLDVKTNAGSAAKQFRSLSSALNGVRSAGRNVASGGTHKSISNIGRSAQSATKHTSKLLSSIKRIAMYRLLRTALKEMTQAFQEGLKNAYAFSKGISGSLAQALDQLASSTGQMKNQMGAAFGELLQTIMPVIMAIVSAINQLMSALSALFAALGGRAQYLSAGENEAAGWDKASGAAKKYKNTLLGFDEINRLNDESGGGGGSADNGQGVWELSDLPDWAMKIKDAIDNGDWKAAGEALADHLNEVIDKWDAYAAGKKLGEKINNAINFAYGFLTRFDFGNAGKKVAEFFNGIFDTVDWELLGRTLVRGITGVFDFVIGFITNLDTKSVAKAIGNFIKGAFSEATEWINGKNWEEIGLTLITKIGDFFRNLDISGIADAISRFLGSALRAAISFLKPIDDLVIEKWNTEIAGADFTETMSNLFLKIGDGLGDVVAWVREHIIVPFLNALLDNSNWSGAEEFKTRIIRYLNYLEFYIRGVSLKISWIIQDVGAIAKAVSEGDWYTAWNNARQLVSDANVDISESAKQMADRVMSAMNNNSKVTVDWGKTYEEEMNSIREESKKSEESITSFRELCETEFSESGNAAKSFLGDLTNVLSTLQKILGISVDGGLLGLFSGQGWSFSYSVNDALGFASGGSIENNGTLFVAGEAGAEVVADMGSRTGVMNVDQMEAAVANGNIGVINAIYGMANAIVKAVNEIDPDITLDGQSLANKMYQYNKNAATRYGATMIT